MAIERYIAIAAVLVVASLSVRLDGYKRDLLEAEQAIDAWSRAADSLTTTILADRAAIEAIRTAETDAKNHANTLRAEIDALRKDNISVRDYLDIVVPDVLLKTIAGPGCTDKDSTTVSK